MFRHKTFIICGLALLPAFAPLATTAQTYYRWVDAEGVSHFSQNPPPEGVDAELDLLPKSSAIDTTPKQTAAQQDQQGVAESLNSFGKDPELCAQVLQSLETMNSYENIVMTDPTTGNGTYLSESERAAEKIRLEGMRDYYC